MQKDSGKLTRGRKLRNIIFSFLISLLFIAALLIAAGSVKWIWAWVLAVILLLSNVVSMILLDPALIEERSGVKKGFNRRDLPLSIIIGRLGPLAVLIVSGFDFRFGWSPPLSTLYAISGLVYILVGYIPFLFRCGAHSGRAGTPCN